MITGLIYSRHRTGRVSSPDPFKDQVELETTIPQSIFDALKAKGHNVIYAKKPIGGSQAIWIDPETDMLIGGSDPRKDGMAAGF